MEITYATDNVAESYAKAIYSAKNKEELISAIEEFGELAEDALEFAKANDFEEMKEAIEKERKQIFAGKKYIPLIIPAKMFKVSLLAHNLKVPFGLAYNRLKEAGKL